MINVLWHNYADFRGSVEAFDELTELFCSDVIQVFMLLNAKALSGF